MSDDVDPQWAPPTPKTPRAHGIFAAPPGAESVSAPTQLRQVGERGWFARSSPRAQAAVSAALLGPTWLLYLAQIDYILPRCVDQQQRATAWGIVTVVYGAYFVVAVAAFARDDRRRRQALALAVLTAGVDVAFSWFVSSPGFREMQSPPLVDVMVKVVFAALLTGYVAAWGIARRRHRDWLIGLVLAALLALVTRWDAVGTDWWPRWKAYIGVFVIGSLLCWAFDAGGRLSAFERPRPAALPDDRHEER